MEPVACVAFRGRSVLATVDVTHAAFDAEVIGMLRDSAAATAPFVRAAAVMGVEGLLGLVMQAAAKLSGRVFARFPARPSALDWLIAQ